MAQQPTKTPRRKPKPGDDKGKKFKKKVSPISSDRVVYVDYKDVNLLRRFMSDRAKIRTRRVSGNDVQQQRDIALAIKVAREMALSPMQPGSLHNVASHDAVTTTKKSTSVIQPR